MQELILRKSETMNYVLNKQKIINCKRQSKSLKRILCTSKFEFSEQEPCVSKCGTARCKTCTIIYEGSTFVFKNGKSFRVKHCMNCKSKNVIYSLICKKCGDFYIGQTSCELRTRMTVHRQQTKNDELRFLNVNRHFNLCANNEFIVFPIYKVNVTNNTGLLEEKELCFINMLKPPLNSQK